jgi:ATP-dependent helicase YprA (DUF1998 family)
MHDDDEEDEEAFGTPAGSPLASPQCVAAATSAADHQEDAMEVVEVVAATPEEEEVYATPHTRAFVERRTLNRSTRAAVVLPAGTEAV